MNTYINWLKEQYEPRRVSVEDIKSGDVELKPLDFVTLESWDDFQTVAEAKQDMMHSEDAKPAERFCDICFVRCRYDGEDHMSSTAGIIPFHMKNDTDYGVMKGQLTKIVDNMEDFI